MLVRPDRPAQHAGVAIVEDDHLCSKTNSRSPRTREQQCPLKVRNRRLPIIAKPQDVAIARSSPSSLELMPVVVCSDGLSLWAAATGGEKQNPCERK